VDFVPEKLAWSRHQQVTENSHVVVPSQSYGVPVFTNHNGVGNTMKPLYDAAQLITALTTKDGAEPSVAWSTDIITYSINTGQVDPTHAEYTTEMAGYVAMTAAMEAAAREAYELWDELIAVDLLEMDDWPNAHMTFNYSSNTGGATYANYQYWLVDNAPRSQYKLADADVWLNARDPDQNDDGDLYLGGFAVETYLYEIGHSLGLTHPGDYNDAATYELDATHAQDTQEYTVMSYFEAGAETAVAPTTLAPRAAHTAPHRCCMTFWRSRRSTAPT
jgi:hypothetical protein